VHGRGRTRAPRTDYDDVIHSVPSAVVYVGGNGHLHHYAVLSAVFRDISNAVLNGICGRSDPRGFAPNQDLARIGSPEAEDGLRQLGSTRSHQAGNTHDLAAPHLQGDVSQTHRGVADSLKLKSNFAESNFPLRQYGRQFPPRHLMDDAVTHDLVFTVSCHSFAVPKDRDAVRYREDFLQPVRNIYDAGASRAKRSDYAEQVFHLGFRERRRGLVHDEEARIGSDRFENLNQLLVIKHLLKHTAGRTTEPCNCVAYMMVWIMQAVPRLLFGKFLHLPRPQRSKRNSATRARSIAGPQVPHPRAARFVGSSRRSQGCGCGPVSGCKAWIGAGSINPNTFQDQLYKHGSIGNPDPERRKCALAHIVDSIEIGKLLVSRDVSLWFADGSNYPGTQNIRKRRRWFAEALKTAHTHLSKDQRMLVEYQPFEPAFYHTDIADWGMALPHAQSAGQNAKVLVDTGHHYQGQNIEQIVAWLLALDMRGGFHFNDRHYADDDLTLGSIDPYRVFRIFHEILYFEWETGKGADVVTQNPKMRQAES
jgi:hypothetical protein